MKNSQPTSPQRPRRTPRDRPCVLCVLRGKLPATPPLTLRAFPDAGGEGFYGLKLEIRKSVDQLAAQHPAMRLITARPDIFARQGSIVSTWRKRAGKRFGPYYSLTYREGGRQQYVYLGRGGQLVESVRKSLAAVREPIQKIRLFDALRRQILASLRVQKISLRALLRPFGLRLKGLEVRGWRISPIRNHLPRCRRFMRRVSPRFHKPRGPQLSPAQRMERFLELRDQASQGRNESKTGPGHSPTLNLRHTQASLVADAMRRLATTPTFAAGVFSPRTDCTAT